MRKTDPVGGLPSGAAGGVLAGTYPSPSFAAQAAGSVLLWDAAGNPLVYGPGALGQVLTAQGAGVPPIWAAASSGGSWATYPNRKGAIFRPIGTGGANNTAGSVLGMTLPATIGVLGTSNVLNNNGGAGGGQLLLDSGVTGTTINSVGGWEGPYTETAAICAPYLALSGVFRGTSNYKSRNWLGLASNALHTLAITTTSALSAMKFVAIGWDLNISANYVLLSGDGTTYSGTDTGIAIGTDQQEQQFILDFRTSGQFSASIQPFGGALVSLGTKSSNVIAGTDATKLGIQWSATVQRNGDVPNCYISSLYLEQN